MKIKNHRLLMDDDSPYPFVRSPNQQGKVQHEFLVFHYTSGGSAAGSISWLTDTAAKASAHVVIGRDGSITQLVPFDRVAWHAGTSSWEGFEGMNRYSLGIELDNAGRLVRRGNSWRSWFEKEYDDNEVIEAVHKYETETAGWHSYTPKQIDSAMDLSVLLMNHYQLRDVLGHEDIARGRKSDPGPAFPMANFRARLQGRKDNHPPIYKTTAVLNIRTGPGTANPTIEGSPLSSDTRIEPLTKQGSWWLVDVLDSSGPTMDMQGWVHSRYVKRSG